MSNGIQKSQADRPFWTAVLTPAECAEVIRILAQTDASVRLFYAGTATDRPSRDRAAGFLCAVAGAASGLPDRPGAAEARALLERWVRRDPDRIVPQFPREAREDDR